MKFIVEITIPDEQTKRPYPVSYKAEIKEMLKEIEGISGAQVKVKEISTEKKLKGK